MPNDIELIKTNFGYQFEYTLNGKKYNVEIHYPSSQSSYHIPYILAFPEILDENCVLAVEANNLETTDSTALLENGLLTTQSLAKKLEDYNAPVLVPILPSAPSKTPYYQQLSRECFDLTEDDPYYRLDLQVLNIIQEAKQNLATKTNLHEKIFLNGYSSSGVFAERFSLLHPEIVEMSCIGGASGSIPVPTSQLGYPLGVKDYEEITGKSFDANGYAQMKLRYYVGELEDARKTSERFDEEGNEAPMHDMSYFDRSVPQSVGYEQRVLFGKNLLGRSQKQIDLLRDLGMDVTQEVIAGRTHNNQNGIGVNELGDQIISGCYKEALSNMKNVSRERSYIALFSSELLAKYGLALDDQEIISSFVKRGIDERLYTDTKDYYHDLKHVEKVLTYTKMISNRLKTPINTNLLMCASLYHDIGKTVGASNQEHGEVGATRFEQMMKGKMSDKDIKVVSLLIKQHASESDTITFTDDTFSDAEKKEIQLMSDILKDADALDRNRLNYPAPMGTCDINRLRTPEAREVYSLSDSLYQDYCEAIIRDKEKNSGVVILNNYELLEQWIEAFERGKQNMFHASLNPGIEELQPTESTQKGSYVYAGIDPVSCYTMAAFRVSLIFPRGKVYFDDEKKQSVRAIKEIFEGSIKDTLDSKYITIYKLPNEQFHKYTAPATAARSGEWVSEGSVRPVQQVSFKALDLLEYLKQTKRLGVIQDYSKEAQLSSFMSSFEIYVWNVKHLKEDSQILDKKWPEAQKLIDYYAKSPEVVETMNRVKQDLDHSIVSYIEDFKNKYGREPDYDNEYECVVPIRDQFYEKYYADRKNKILNYEVLESLNKSNTSTLEGSQREQTQSLTKESQFVYDVMSDVTSRLPDQLGSEELAVGIGKGLNDKMQLYEESSFQKKCITSTKNDVINALEIGCDKKEEYVNVVTQLTELRTTQDISKKQAIEQDLSSFKQSKNESKVNQAEPTKSGQLIKKNNSSNNPNGGFANVLTISLLIAVICAIAVVMVYLFVYKW